MEESMISRCKEYLELEERDPAGYSPLVLAYIGDAVYELVIRTKIVNRGNTQVNKMHRAAAGLVKAQAQAQMYMLLEEELTEEDQKAIHAYLEKTPVAVTQAPGDLTFDLVVAGEKDGHKGKVRIAGAHTNVVLKELDGKILLKKEIGSCYFPETQNAEADGPSLTIEGIVDFALSVETEDVKETLDRQIAYNTAISAEGLRGDYGANVGRVLLSTYGDDVKVRARAAAAAGSDARMNGCELPVVINSGSGNQGLTASLPVIEYAKEIGADRERLYRALVISNLTAVHLKEGIGRLSAYCGAVTAGAGAGAGIAWLLGGGLDEINHTIVNTLANVSGIICDGAKASCAAKIATSVEAGILGYYMYKNGQEFRGGDGIVKKGVERTIENVARLGRDGMRETDREILEIMIGDAGQTGN